MVDMVNANRYARIYQIICSTFKYSQYTVAIILIAIQIQSICTVHFILIAMIYMFVSNSVLHQFGHVSSPKASLCPVDPHDGGFQQGGNTWKSYWSPR